MKPVFVVTLGDVVGGVALVLMVLGLVGYVVVAAMLDRRRRRKLRAKGRAK